MDIVHLSPNAMKGCVLILYGNNKNHLLVERTQVVNLET